MSSSYPLAHLAKPIIVAPMAGGPTTPSLIVDACAGGGWGMLAGGYLDVNALAKSVHELRQLLAASGSASPVGVNLFVPGEQSDASADGPGDDTKTQQALARFRERLQPLADRFGVTLGDGAWNDDHYPAKITWLIKNPADVVTFTFGLPSATDVEALHHVGTSLGATVTTPDDARSALERGADFLIVQGCEAGGHQSTFTVESPEHNRPLLPLLREISEFSTVPLIAAGGIATPDDVHAALEAGASSVSVGTAFLRAASAGTSTTHRAALVSPDFAETTLSRAFSGRSARTLKNAFSEEFSDAPATYPQVNVIAGPVRKAAAAARDPQWTNLWAGTGWRRSQQASPPGLLEADAASIVTWLAGD